MSVTQFPAAVDTSDIPSVAARELAVALKLLSGQKALSLPSAALSEDDLRRVEQFFWQASPRDRTRKVAVLLRFRSLLEVCRGRRLSALVESHGEVALLAILNAAATMRLNAKWGFNPLKLARAASESLAAAGAPDLALAA